MGLIGAGGRYLYSIKHSQALAKTRLSAFIARRMIFPLLSSPENLAKITPGDPACRWLYIEIG